MWAYVRSHGDEISRQIEENEADLRGVTYKRAERDHLANMLGHLTRDPALMALVPEGAPGVERLRLSLS